MVGIELQMITSFYFFDILRDVAMATNLVAKIGQNYLAPYIHRSVNPKWNGILLPQWAR